MSLRIELPLKTGETMKNSGIFCKRHWITLFTTTILLSVVSAAQSSPSKPSSPTPPASQNQQQGQADVKLTVECILGAKGECDENRTEEFRGSLKLRVSNLEAWVAQGNSPWNLILFLNGRQMKGLHPVGTDAQTGELEFRLQRTNESAAAWDELTEKDKNWKLRGIARSLRASVGLDGGLAYNADKKAHFELIFLSPAWMLLCFAFALGTLAGLFWLARKTSLLKDKVSGPYSLSRTQMAIWSWVVMNAYFFLFVMTRDPTIDIPVSILGLLGISATTYVAAVLVDRRDTTTTPAPSRGFLRDISGGQDGVELHRLQIIAWTGVMVFVFILRVFHTLAIPDFNPTLLGLLGLSAGTYVGFKFPESQKSQANPPPPAAKGATSGAQG